MKSDLTPLDKATARLLRVISQLPEDEQVAAKKTAIARITQSMAAAGRKPIPTACARCGEIQPSARKAWMHCRKSQKKGKR